MEDPTMVIVLAANKSDLGDPRAFMKVPKSGCPAPAFASDVGRGV